MAGKTKQLQRNRGSRTLSKSVLCSALAAVLATSVPSAASAADRYWDANGTTIGSGGSGTWNLSNLNWSPNGDGVSGPFQLPWNNALLDNAIFGGTAGTVNLGTPITAHNLTFNTAGYVLTGNTLTLGGASPTITTAGSATINSIIAGTSGLIKAGAGTLQLSGANTYSGGISILDGTLYGVTDGALGAAANNITTAAGTTVGLRIDGAGTARSVTIGDGGTLTVSGAGVGSALISGNGRVNVAPSNNALSMGGLGSLFAPTGALSDSSPAGSRPAVTAIVRSCRRSASRMQQRPPVSLNPFVPRSWRTSLTVIPCAPSRSANSRVIIVIPALETQ